MPHISVPPNSLNLGLLWIGYLNSVNLDNHNFEMGPNFFLQLINGNNKK